MLRLSPLRMRSSKGFVGVIDIPPISFDERRSMVTCAMSEMKRSMFKNDRNQNESNSFRFLIFEHNLCLPSFTTAHRL